MPTDIVIPALGESITSGVIASWKKKDGDLVARDETVLELETDKITLELPSPAAGVLKRRAAEGDTVEVGSIVGVIAESNGAATPAAAPAPAPAKAPEPPASKAASGAPASAEGDPRATPLARKMAEEKRVDLGAITGTGPGGRIREQDVLAYVQGAEGAGAPAAPPAVAAAPAAKPAAPAMPSPAATGRGAHRERLTPLRARIAQRLVEAQHAAAMLTTFNEVDMTAVMAMRGRHKDDFEKKHGVGLGFMSFFVRAAASALRAQPMVNACLVENEAGALEIEKHDYCDIAVAVSTPKGLTVPVLRNAETLSFAQIESGIKDLAARARDGKLALEDLQGGTFTITNGGIYGSMMSTPILNPPQAAILGMHNIVRRAVENPDKPGSGEVVVRPMMYLALSYDHRIIDGAEAVTFLVHVKRCLEEPQRLLLGL